MNDLFSNKLANSHNKTQDWFLAEMGLGRDNAQYSVEFEEYHDEGSLVTITDQSQVGPFKTLYTFEFSSLDAGRAFADIMELEVGRWDAYDFYTVEDVQRDAVESHERHEMGYMQGRGAA
jgi:hypothetical protein